MIKKILILIIAAAMISDRLRSGSGGVRYVARHASEGQWDALSPVGSPSCSSPYTSSSHLSSCSSDPSLPTTNQLSPRITSSSNSYLDRRRGSVQLPTVSGRSMTNILSSKRRFMKTLDNTADDDGIEGNFRKKQRIRQVDLSLIDGECIHQCSTCDKS
jgi:hypothetical protein